ncbi:MAG: putative tryptophan/tyrosine transport system substrate-binding protein [Candidatus Dependentiae bacterium]|nr:putative tryptophan/tyrosine transport system substrate-binding protein [Candidatus Dependentiae bacterium]
MNTTLKTALAFTCLLLAAGGIYYYKTRPSRMFRIGIVSCPSIAFHEHLVGLLKKQIATDKRFIMEDFAVPSVNDQLSCSAICNTALESKADIILAAGITCSQCMVQAAAKRKSTKPIVFFGVASPTTYGIISALDKPEKYVTGIASSQGFDENFNAADLLMHAKPQVKRVLLPYLVCPDDNEKVVKAAAATFAEHGVGVTILPIYDTAEALSMVAGKLPTHDAMMYFENDGLVSCATGLGKLASQHQVTMFASSFDGVECAALSYSANLEKLAKAAFLMARHVVVKNGTYVPVKVLNVKRYFRINLPICKEQGLKELNPSTVISAIQQDSRLALMHKNTVVT